MVAQLAAMPIVTAVGEFALPYLIKEAGKIGVKKFKEPKKRMKKEIKYIKF